MKIDQLVISMDQLKNTQSKKADENETKRASFSKTLMESIEKVNAMQKDADKAIDELVIGDSKDIVQTMIAMEKADVSFRMMIQIRNKILQAYEEVMRMQV
jgi:flagellar hook-basal body complex protein FliE